MSGDDVYSDEMARNRFSDHDLELLLSGGIPEDESLARLAGVLRTMQLHVRAPDEEAISRFAAQAAQLAAAPPADSPTAPSRGRITALASTRRFVATAAGFALVMGMTGVAAASDGAAPGHPLYGIDRTLESLGIGDGGPAERIEEAGQLLGRGLVSDAIAHAAEALTDGENRGNQGETSPAAKALLAAADSVTETESGAVRESVTAMLAEIAAMIDSDEFDGAEIGRRVAELARSLGRENGGDIATPPEPQTGDHGQGNGPPDDVPAGPPQGTPGGSPDNATDDPPDVPPDGPPGDPPGGPSGGGGPPDAPPDGDGPPGRP